MKAAYICMDPGVPVFGTKGCSIHVQEILRFFCEIDVNVTLYALRLGGERPKDLDRVAVRHIRLPDANGRYRERLTYESNAVLRDLMESDGPFDFIYERHSLFGREGMRFARENDLIGIVEVNAPLLDEQQRFRRLENADLAADAAESVFGDADLIVAVSDDVSRYCEQFAGAAGKVIVVPNGVDCKRFRPGLPPRAPARAGVFTVGFVGSLKPWHGLSDLLRGFDLFAQKFPESRLLIVGDGPERTAVESLAAELGQTERLELTGALDHAQVPGLLASMDVAAVTYPNVEECYFSPLKLFEYLAAGLPIVATASGQIPVIVEHEVTALLVPPGDPESLADALVQLRVQPTLAAELASASRQQAVVHHTWHATGRRILEAARLAYPVMDEAA